MIKNAEEAIEILLSRGKIALVDREFSFLKSYKWTASPVKSGAFYALAAFKNSRGGKE